MRHTCEFSQQTYQGDKKLYKHLEVELQRERNPEERQRLGRLRATVAARLAYQKACRQLIEAWRVLQ